MPGGGLGTKGVCVVSGPRSWSEASVVWTRNQVLYVLGFSLILNFKLACIQYHIYRYVLYNQLNPSSRALVQFDPSPVCSVVKCST